MNKLYKLKEDTLKEEKIGRNSCKNSAYLLCTEKNSIMLNLADLRVMITSEASVFPIDRVKQYEAEGSKDNGKPDIIAVVTQEDIDKVKNLYHLFYKRRDEEMPVITEENYWMTAMFDILLKDFINFQVIYLHGSAIRFDGKAYLFMAPSGTGKSTHTRLWREQFGNRVEMINDDKPLIKVTDTQAIAYGSPLNGKHGLGSNISAPISAIIRLKRGAVNSIKPVSKEEAFEMLYSQTVHFRDYHKTQALISIISGIMQRVDFYELKCNMDPDAVLTVYRELMGHNKN